MGGASPDPSRPLFPWLWAWLRRKKGGKRNDVPAKIQNDECTRMPAHAFIVLPLPLFPLSHPIPTPRHHPPKPPDTPQMPACLRPRQPCHGETGGTQIYVTLTPPPLHPPPAPPPPTTCFVTVKCCQSVVFFIFFGPLLSREKAASCGENDVNFSLLALTRSPSLRLVRSEQLFSVLFFCMGSLWVVVIWVLIEWIYWPLNRYTFLVANSDTSCRHCLKSRLLRGLLCLSFSLSQHWR